MATSQTTIEYLLDQIARAGDISVKKMFGEYCLYLAGKPVALVCDDQLYLKPTKAAQQLISNPTLGLPYPKAKPYFLIEADLWEDSDWMVKLIQVTAAELPVSRPKKKKSTK